MAELIALIVELIVQLFLAAFKLGILLFELMGLLISAIVEWLTGPKRQPHGEDDTDA